MSIGLFLQRCLCLYYLIAPVHVEESVKESRGRLFFRGERALFHAEQVADGVEIVGLAVLLADLLLDEFVPVVDGERLGRNHKFVPVSLFRGNVNRSQ